MRRRKRKFPVGFRPLSMAKKAKKEPEKILSPKILPKKTGIRTMVSTVLMRLEIARDLANLLAEGESIDGMIDGEVVDAFFPPPFEDGCKLMFSVTNYEKGPLVNASLVSPRGVEIASAQGPFLPWRLSYVTRSETYDLYVTVTDDNGDVLPYRPTLVMELAERRNIYSEQFREEGYPHLF